MSIGAAVGIGSALIGASSAKKAAKSQERAAGQQLALEKQIYDETTQRFDPFYKPGVAAQQALSYELGLGPKPTFGGSRPEITEIPASAASPFSPREGRELNQYQLLAQRAAGGESITPGTFQVNGQSFGSRAEAEAYANANSTAGTENGGFKATPGYDFRKSEGQSAIDNSAASRGGLFSGATLKAQQTFGDNIASAEYGNYINRLSGMAGSGQAAAGNQANAGSNYAAGAGNAFAGIGNAQSAGAIGVGNALQGGLNTGLGIWKYQQAQAAGQNALGGGGGFGMGSYGGFNGNGGLWN